MGLQRVAIRVAERDRQLFVRVRDVVTQCLGCEGQTPREPEEPLRSGVLLRLQLVDDERLKCLRLARRDQLAVPDFLLSLIISLLATCTSGDPRQTQDGP